MPTPPSGEIPPSRQAYALAGWICLTGCLAAVLGDFITLTLREGISPVGNSISRTAAGDHSFVVDIGLCWFALGVTAVAWALFDWSLGGRAYRTGTGLLALCAAAIFVLAAWNGYDRKSADDFGLHMNLVYAMAGLFPLSALLIAQGLDAIHRNWKRFSWGVVALWVLSGPLYFLAPDSMKGLYERVTLMLLVAWVAALSVLLIRHARKDAAL